MCAVFKDKSIYNDACNQITPNKVRATVVYKDHNSGIVSVALTKEASAL